MHFIIALSLSFIVIPRLIYSDSERFYIPSVIANSFQDAEASCDYHTASVHNEEDQKKAKALCDESGANICWIGGIIDLSKSDCSLSQWADISPVDYSPEFAFAERNHGCRHRNICFQRGYAGLKSCRDVIFNDGTKRIYAICNALRIGPPRFRVISATTNTRREAYELCVTDGWLQVYDLASLHNKEEQKAAKILCDKSGADLCWTGGIITEMADCSLGHWTDRSPVDYSPEFTFAERNHGCRNHYVCFKKGYGGITSCGDTQINDGTKKIYPICNGYDMKSASVGHYDFINDKDWSDWIGLNSSYLWIITITIIVNVLAYCITYHFCIKTRIKSEQYVYKHVNNKEIDQI